MYHGIVFQGGGESIHFVGSFYGWDGQGGGRGGAEKDESGAGQVGGGGGQGMDSTVWQICGCMSMSLFSIDGFRFGGATRRTENKGTKHENMRYVRSKHKKGYRFVEKKQATQRNMLLKQNV